jgi:hypothetical protein
MSAASPRIAPILTGQALFWSEVTGWQEDPDDPNNAGDPEGRIVSPQGFSLLFIPVPDSTTTGFPHLVVT